MKIVVTGAAGFIGSNLCDFLLKNGVEVIGIDNFATGQKEFLADAMKSRCFSFYEFDLLDFAQAKKIFHEVQADVVIHLASNADVRFGLQHTRKDLEQGMIVTYNVLEAARLAGVKKFAFASTGSVYGEASIFPTPETCPFPIQTSLYAANKIGSEGLITAYTEGFGMKSYIFRFVSILGERYSHGHVFDFVSFLLNNPNTINVLGNGKQRKAYLYVGDCVQAIWHVITNSEEKVNLYNLGPDEYISVDESLNIICRIMNVNPKRFYAGGERGWVGDSPFIFLDSSKLKKTGWTAQKRIAEGIELTVKYLLENTWLFERRLIEKRQQYK